VEGGRRRMEGELLAVNEHMRSQKEFGGDVEGEGEGGWREGEGGWREGEGDGGREKGDVWREGEGGCMEGGEDLIQHFAAKKQIDRTERESKSLARKIDINYKRSQRKITEGIWE
jgi:hypothetical protein